ncbi:zinc ABC transporter substrate-binding protein AztC [Rhodococcus sp. NPDC058521]|uniref:zinc ABC transporter substrate-binding protein AztC n=1 Tax=Rhodococcus sp. NPDC058521 TaxID=3346536 RepID=UPI0036467872
MTRTAAVFSVLIGLVLAVAGCSVDMNGDRPTVVVTTNILGDITQNIVGDAAEVRVLMPRNADPHSFEVSAAESARIASADLVISNGLGLEEGIAKTVDAARSEDVPVLEVAPAVNPIAFDAGAGAGTPDPHFWTDPDRVADAVGLIRDAVVEHVDGVEASVIDERAQRYGGRISELTSTMTARFQSIPEPQRILITNHHVFGYLAQRFDFDVIGAVVPSGTTLASPSSADLADLSTAVRNSGVRAIFVDSSQPSKLAEALAKESGTDVEVVALFTESLGEDGSGAATYLEMMTSNTNRITKALQ